MEVECVKYHERMDSEQAVCRHAGDYCKFRSSCIIHFLSGEKKREGGTSGAEAVEAVQKEESDDNDCRNPSNRDSEDGTP